MRTLIARTVFSISGMLALCLAAAPVLAGDAAAKTRSTSAERYDLRFAGLKYENEFAAYDGTTVVQGELVHSWISFMRDHLFRNADMPVGQLELFAATLSVEPLPADVAQQLGIEASPEHYLIDLVMTTQAQRRLLKRLGIPHGDPSSTDNRVCESRLPVTVRLRDYFSYVAASDVFSDSAKLDKVVSVNGPLRTVTCGEYGLRPHPATVDGVLVFDLADKFATPEKAASHYRVRPVLETAQPLLGASGSASGAAQRYRIRLGMDSAQQMDVLKRLGVPDPLPDGQSRRTCGFRLPLTVQLREYAQDDMPDTPSVDGWAVVEKMTYSADSVLQRPCKASELRQLQVPEAVVTALALPADTQIDQLVAEQMQMLLGK